MTDEARGPIQTQRDATSAYLRRSGVQGVTGQRMDPLVVGAALVDDARNLVPPLEPGFAALSWSLAADPLERVCVEVSVGGQGVWVESITSAGINFCYTLDQQVVPRTNIGALIPALVSFPREGDRSLYENVGPRQTFGTRFRHVTTTFIPLNPNRAWEVRAFQTPFSRFFLYPGQFLYISTENINQSSRGSLMFREIPQALAESPARSG